MYLIKHDFNPHYSSLKHDIAIKIIKGLLSSPQRLVRPIEAYFGVDIGLSNQYLHVPHFTLLYLPVYIKRI